MINAIAELDEDACDILLIGRESDAAEMYRMKLVLDGYRVITITDIGDSTAYRNGWRPDSLKIGEVVSVTGSRAKSEASYRVSGTITKADGTRVWGGGAAAQQ